MLSENKLELNQKLLPKYQGFSVTEVMQAAGERK